MSINQRILIVEDDDIIRQLLAEALSEDGYCVESAGTCEDALHLLGDWSPHLILLDLRMPDMDTATFRVKQRALGHAADVPVIVVSASNRGPEQAAAIGAAAVFPKPFDLLSLLDQVQQMLVET